MMALVVCAFLKNDYKAYCDALNKDLFQAVSRCVRLRPSLCCLSHSQMAVSKPCHNQATLLVLQSNLSALHPLRVVTVITHNGLKNVALSIESQLHGTLPLSRMASRRMNDCATR